ncbi:hypothetical protein ACHAPT_010249 [Fusarium lateritium]
MDTASGSATHPRYLIIHQVVCPGSSPAHSRHSAITPYLDVPRLFRGDSKASALRGRSPGRQALLNAKDDPNISFIIYRSYNCVDYHNSVLEDLQKASSAPQSANHLPDVFILASDADSAIPQQEHMEVNSTHLRDAMVSVERLEFSDMTLMSGWDRESNMLAPYLHFFHVRPLMRKFCASLHVPQRQHMSLLLEYLHRQFGPEYDEAENLFARGYVTKKHFHKLFGPGEILVTLERGHPTAMIAKHPPLPGSDPIKLDCETWVFDGRFSIQTKTTTISWPKDDLDLDKIQIQTLAAFPLRLDRSGLEQRLRRRGEIFWSCRTRRFISYTAPRESLEFQMRNGRYMIDTETYRQFRGRDHPGRSGTGDNPLVQPDSPPPGHFVLLLPATIYGFGFHDKTWRKLAVEHIVPIAWNKRAFDLLVLPASSKEVLAALVTNHTTNMQPAEVVRSQGGGMVILLHGGPGTGKTFTAEALAEIGEKPLYRMTSSDIGTDLDKVKKNLDAAFYLGGIWDADECDVFLEERSLSDIARNAVVSVILQALEHYEGILILTSNRVGTLDEALKSRVRLAVAFSLTGGARSRLWRNFIEQLRREQDNDKLTVDYDDLDDRLEELVEYKLTGREIQNAIQTAKELASFRREPLAFKHVERSIEISNDFDRYLQNVSGGLDYDIRARESGLR